VAGITTYLSILTLNTECQWTQLPHQKTPFGKLLKRKIQKSVVYRRPISLTKTNSGLRLKAGRRFTRLIAPEKSQGIAIFVSDKVDFKLTMIKQDKEGHFIIIKGKICQEEITIINLYAPNLSAPNFIKHTLKDLKSHIDSNTVVVGDFNTHLSPIDRSSQTKNQ
jgi:hypothetical protein